MELRRQRHRAGRALLGDQSRDPMGQEPTRVSPYAAPARAPRTWTGLPRHLHRTSATLDIFRDEDITYARTPVGCGGGADRAAPAIRGAQHAFEALARRADVSQRAIGDSRPSACAPSNHRKTVARQRHPIGNGTAARARYPGRSRRLRRFWSGKRKIVMAQRRMSTSGPAKVGVNTG